MNSSISSLFLVVLLGTQLGFSEGHRNLYSEENTRKNSARCQCNGTSSASSPPRNFIAWEDMILDQHWERHYPNGGYTDNQVILVAEDGSGDSVTVQGAVDLVPDHNTQRVKIYIRPGIYRETVVVPRNKPYISFIGNPNTNTVITGHKQATDKDARGNQIGTYRSATVTIESDYFCATGIAFQNTIVAGPGPGGRSGAQAVALRISGDKAMLYRIKALGSQDTLLDEKGTHYFYQSYIEGAIDFIFGNAKSLYQDCTFHSNARGTGAIAAHHRDSAVEDTGFSFVNCIVNGTGHILLGRAWGRYSRTIYSYCDIDGIIRPEGWNDWRDPSRRETAWFAEYQCRGAGANKRGRVPWMKTVSYEETRPFLGRDFIDGRQWLRL